MDDVDEADGKRYESVEPRWARTSPMFLGVRSCKLEWLSAIMPRDASSSPKLAAAAAAAAAAARKWSFLGGSISRALVTGEGQDARVRCFPVLLLLLLLLLMVVVVVERLGVVKLRVRRGG